MAKPTVIAVNQTVGNITLVDLGSVVIPGSGQLNLTISSGLNYPISELQEKDDLFDEITNDNILINDGSRTLSKAESLNYLSSVSTVNESAVYVKNNIVATTDPAVSNDNTEGYAITSVWINTISSLVYTCADASTGAAVWNLSPTIITHLNDVDTITTPPTAGDSFIWDGTTWVPSSAAGSSSSNNYISAHDETNQPAGAARAKGTVNLNGGASGSINDITVNGVSIMSGVEAFDTDLSTTARNVADNISVNTSSPNYSAISTGSLITIFAVSPGTLPNGLVVTSFATVITTTDVDMGGGTDATVNIFEPVYFSNNDKIDGWYHPPNTAIFRCTQSSLFAATFDLNAEKTGGGSPAIAVTATLDNVEISGSHQGMDMTSNNTTFTVSRTFLFEALVGQEFRVEFAAGNTTVSITPAPDPTGTTLPISATLTIRRLT